MGDAGPASRVDGAPLRQADTLSPEVPRRLLTWLPQEGRGENKATSGSTRHTLS